MNNNEYCYYALLIPSFDIIAACKYKRWQKVRLKTIILLKQIEESALQQLKRLCFFGKNFVPGNKMNK